jgi:hypothetical protein
MKANLEGDGHVGIGLEANQIIQNIARTRIMSAIMKRRGGAFNTAPFEFILKIQMRMSIDIIILSRKV